MVNGQIVVDGADGESYELLYDAGGRNVARYRRSGGVDYVSRTAYDLRGNKTLEFFDERVGAGSSGVAQTFSYDADRRLTQTRSYFAASASKQGRYDPDAMRYITINT